MRATAIKDVWIHDCPNGAAVVFDCPGNEVIVIRNDAEISRTPYPNGITITIAGEWISAVEQKNFDK